MGVGGGPFVGRMNPQSPKPSRRPNVALAISCRPSPLSASSPHAARPRAARARPKGPRGLHEDPQDPLSGRAGGEGRDPVMSCGGLPVGSSIRQMDVPRASVGDETTRQVVRPGRWCHGQTQIPWTICHFGTFPRLNARYCRPPLPKARSQRSFLAFDSSSRLPNGFSGVRLRVGPGQDGRSDRRAKNGNLPVCK